MKLNLKFRDKETELAFVPDLVQIENGEINLVVGTINDAVVTYMDGSKYATVGISEVELLTEGRTIEAVFKEFIKKEIPDQNAKHPWTYTDHSGGLITLRHKTAEIQAVSHKELLSLIVSEWMDIMETKIKEG
jgi:hypothetical protein